MTVAAAANNINTVGGLMSLSKRAFAEFLGTFWLVLGGCGSAVLAAKFPQVGIGLVGVSLAFGLTVLTMAYGIGHISGCHLNPAVTFGLMVGGRFKAADVPAYVIAQVLGGIVAALLLYYIASGAPGFDPDRRPGRERLRRAFPGRLLAGLGTSHRGGDDLHVPHDHPRRHRRACTGGLCPDRHRARTDPDPPDQHPGDQYLSESGAQHRPGGGHEGWALSQLWLFWLAPLLGAGLAGVAYRWLAGERKRL